MKLKITLVLVLLFNSLHVTLAQYPDYPDTYYHVANNTQSWGPYNVHDPSILKIGDWYYSYSTDVKMGGAIQAGIQIRKSKDLINWQWVGFVFNGLPAKAKKFITDNGGTPFDGIWAPYIMQVGSEYRLYYSLSSPEPTPRLSCIVLATATSPEGPWTEKDLVVVSYHSAVNNRIQTNAIDPTVIVAPGGRHYMYYGSAWDGIYVLELNPTTGLAKTAGSIGTRISQRGSTSGKINGNIEGPEIIYNPDLKKYFLFISYDWLHTKYNVRVGRGDSPTGPFYDYSGDDMNTAIDHEPMIISPYKFENHPGWQGVSHMAVFTDGGSNYYIAHQGRPVKDDFCMDLHVRKLFWTTDGWPVASPERFAGAVNAAVSKPDFAGDWEHLVHGYTVVPGFSVEQTDPQVNKSTRMSLDAAGTINGDANNTWSFTYPNLTLSWGNGTYIDKLIVAKEYDWENKAECIVYSGLSQFGTAIWGKKVNTTIYNQRINPIQQGVYQIFNKNSNLAIETTSDAQNSNVYQSIASTSKTQLWKILKQSDGNFKLVSVNSANGRVMSVANNSADNGANVAIATDVNGNGQSWAIEFDQNFGFFKVLSKSSSKLRGLDVDNSSIMDNANIMQWEFLSGRNQWWYFKYMYTDAPTSIQTLNDNATSPFSLFPTVVEKDLFLLMQADAASEASVSIVDVMGKEVYSTSFTANEGENSFSMDVSQLSSGLYFCRVKTGENMYSIKIVKGE